VARPDAAAAPGPDRSLAGRGVADVLPTTASEDTDRAWGDWRAGADPDDERLLRERPPHWG
jgi:hypothetical protein